MSQHILGCWHGSSGSRKARLGPCPDPSGGVAESRLASGTLSSTRRPLLQVCTHYAHSNCEFLKLRVLHFGNFATPKPCPYCCIAAGNQKIQPIVTEADMLSPPQAWMTIRGAATPLTWSAMWTCCAGWRLPPELLPR